MSYSAYKFFGRLPINCLLFKISCKTDLRTNTPDLTTMKRLPVIYNFVFLYNKYCEKDPGPIKMIIDLQSEVFF